MHKLPSITPQKVIKILEKKGFVLDRVKGSHHIYIIQKREEGLSFPLIKKICRREHYSKS